MCTVSYIPGKDKYCIVSNRDERIHRKPALRPAIYTINQQRIIFPKDGDAGGSWIAICENGNVCVLLNGAFENHHAQPPYQQSRGLIFLTIISAQNSFETFAKLDLSKIEPFTIILVEKNELRECRWDGKNKHTSKLNSQQSHIWSSVTLYDAKMIEERELWFLEFIKNNPSPTLPEILNFHQFAGVGNRQVDLCMNRNDEMLTVSVTGVEITREYGRMEYLDILTQNHFLETLPFVSVLQLS